MDLQMWLMSLRRNWWMVVLAVLVTAGMAAALVTRQTPIYRASTVVELRPSALLDSPSQIIDAYTALDRRSLVNTAARKATSTALQALVATRLNVPLDVFDDANLTASVLPDTNLIEISASSNNPQLAAALANTVAQELRSQQLDRALEIEVIDAARVPAAPIAPQPARTITLAVLFGLLIGLATAVAEYVLRGQRPRSRRPRAEVSTPTYNPYHVPVVDERANHGVHVRR